MRPHPRAARLPRPHRPDRPAPSPSLRSRRGEHATIDHGRQRPRPTPPMFGSRPSVPTRAAPLGGGPVQGVKRGDRGRDVVVRPGEVPPGRRRQRGDVALDTGSRDVDQDRQQRVAGLGRLEQRPPGLEPQPDRGEEAGRPVPGEDDTLVGAHEQRRVAGRRARWLEALYSYDKDADYAVFAPLLAREGLAPAATTLLERAGLL